MAQLGSGTGTVAITTTANATADAAANPDVAGCFSNEVRSDAAGSEQDSSSEEEPSNKPVEDGLFDPEDTMLWLQDSKFNSSRHKVALADRTSVMMGAGLTSYEMHTQLRHQYTEMMASEQYTIQAAKTYADSCKRRAHVLKMVKRVTKEDSKFCHHPNRPTPEPPIAPEPPKEEAQQPSPFARQQAQARNAVKAPKKPHAIGFGSSTKRMTSMPLKKGRIGNAEVGVASSPLGEPGMQQGQGSVDVLGAGPWTSHDAGSTTAPGLHRLLLSPFAEDEPLQSPQFEPEEPQQTEQRLPQQCTLNEAQQPTQNEQRGPPHYTQNKRQESSQVEQDGPQQSSKKQNEVGKYTQYEQGSTANADVSHLEDDVRQRHGPLHPPWSGQHCGEGIALHGIDASLQPQLHPTEDVVLHGHEVSSWPQLSPREESFCAGAAMSVHLQQGRLVLSSRAPDGEVDRAQWARQSRSRQQEQSGSNMGSEDVNSVLQHQGLHDDSQQVGEQMVGGTAAGRDDCLQGGPQMQSAAGAFVARHDDCHPGVMHMHEQAAAAGHVDCQPATEHMYVQTAANEVVSDGPQGQQTVPQPQRSHHTRPLSLTLTQAVELQRLQQTVPQTQSSRHAVELQGSHQGVELHSCSQQNSGTFSTQMSSVPVYLTGSHPVAASAHKHPDAASAQRHSDAASAHEHPDAASAHEHPDAASAHEHPDAASAPERPVAAWAQQHALTQDLARSIHSSHSDSPPMYQHPLIPEPTMTSQVLTAHNLMTPSTTGLQPLPTDGVLYATPSPPHMHRLGPPLLSCSATSPSNSSQSGYTAASAAKGATATARTAKASTHLPTYCSPLRPGQSLDGSQELCVHGQMGATSPLINSAGAAHRRQLHGSTSARLGRSITALRLSPLNNSTGAAHNSAGVVRNSAGAASHQGAASPLATDGALVADSASKLQHLKVWQKVQLPKMCSEGTLKSVDISTVKGERDWQSRIADGHMSLSCSHLPRLLAAPGRGSAPLLRQASGFSDGGGMPQGAVQATLTSSFPALKGAERLTLTPLILGHEACEDGAQAPRLLAALPQRALKNYVLVSQACDGVSSIPKSMSSADLRLQGSRFQ